VRPTNNKAPQGSRPAGLEVRWSWHRTPMRQVDFPTSRGGMSSPLTPPNVQGAEKTPYLYSPGTTCTAPAGGPRPGKRGKDPTAWAPRPADLYRKGKNAQAQNAGVFSLGSSSGWPSAGTGAGTRPVGLGWWSRVHRHLSGLVLEGVGRRGVLRKKTRNA